MHEALGDYDKDIDYYKKVVTGTYDSKTLDIAMESVKRCEKKKNFLSGKTTQDTNAGTPHSDLPPGM